MKGISTGMKTFLSTEEKEQLLNECFRDVYLPIDVHYYDRVTSTNTVLMEMGVAGAQEGTLVAADQQTAGKGRRGRSFYSPEHTGVYFSVLLRPQFSMREALMITAAAAVAVARAIEQLVGAEPAIKWVNDLFLHGKKVCGILAEAFLQGQNPFVVLGIGVNLMDPPGGYPADARNQIGSLFGTGACDREFGCRLIGRTLFHFFDIYHKLPERTFMQEYRSRSCVINQKVLLISPDTERSAYVLDIDDEAQLVVRLDDGTVEKVNTGEISIRLSRTSQ